MTYLATRFRMPVGDENQPFSSWFNASGFGNYYTWTDNGSLRGGWHRGEDWNLDLGGNSEIETGSRVYSVANGEVVGVGSWGTGWGQYVIVRHTLPEGMSNGIGGDSIYSFYGHVNASVSTGDSILIGDEIGSFAALGHGTTAHLHFEMWSSDLRASPGSSGSNGYLPPASASTKAEAIDIMVNDGWVAPTTFINQPGYRAAGLDDDFASFIEADMTEGFGSVSVGDVGTYGTLESVGDSDSFHVSLDAGTVYRFAARGVASQSSTLSDVTLSQVSFRLRDEGGNIIDTQHGTISQDPTITFQPTVSGDYYLTVFSSSDLTGSYRVSGIVSNAEPIPDVPQGLPWLTGPISFADIVEAGHANNDEDFSAIFEAMFGLSVTNLAYTGSLNAAFLTNDFTISGDGVPGFQHGSGLMLSSGGFPGSSNSQSSFTVNHNTPGDADLTATALAAFSGAGQTRDAAVIEFTINVTDPNITALRAELVFGSEEFPVYINSSYVDIAALYVNGVNHALFNNDANRPLSVIIQNVEEGYILNNNNGNGPFGDYDGWSGAAAPYGIEWNGFSAPLSVRAPLQMGENVIKIGVADTGDTALDSGLFIANLQLIGGGGGGTGVLSILDATNSNSVTPTTLTEEVLIGSDPTTIAGTPQTLNNDIIVGFKTSDLLVFNGHQFSLDQMQISAGSAILEIDTNSDGEFDTKVTLAGVSHESNFNVTLVDGNTVITYDDPDVSGLSVSGLIAGRGGEGMSGSTVTFVPDSGDGVQIGTNTAGLFSLSLPAGSSGHLHALREYDPATDGTITASDALDVLRLAVGLAPSWGNATPLDFIAADINQDGEVTAADALEVLRAAVGLQSVHQPRWVFFDPDIDLSGVNRGNTDIELGVRIDALTAGLADVSMTGVLLGNMQEYA